MTLNHALFRGTDHLHSRKHMRPKLAFHIHRSPNSDPKHSAYKFTATKFVFVTPEPVNNSEQKTALSKMTQRVRTQNLKQTEAEHFIRGPHAIKAVTEDITEQVTSVFKGQK